MKIRFAVVTTLLLAASAQADNFRCGKWIATTDLSVPELLSKCGEPASRATRIEDVMARSQTTGGMYKTGERTVETWIYERGTSAAPMVVTLVDVRIKSIERQQ